MYEHVITCLHTCVSALIWNMFGGSSSTSELTLTWLSETPALIGPTYSNYRLPGRGGWRSQSVSPAKRPRFWGRKWPYMDTLDQWLEARLCGPLELLTYNNLTQWTHRLDYGMDRGLKTCYIWGNEWRRRGKRMRAVLLTLLALQDNIIAWFANQ